MREGSTTMTVKVFCGVDWAEDHHDIALVDAQGQLIAKRRITDDAAGFRRAAGPAKPKFRDLGVGVAGLTCPYSYRCG
jgi:hypothetical protein